MQYKNITSVRVLVGAIQQDINLYSALCTNDISNTLYWKYSSIHQTLVDAMTLIMQGSAQNNAHLMNSALHICQVLFDNKKRQMAIGTTALMIASCLGDVAACESIMHDKPYDYLMCTNKDGQDAMTLAANAETFALLNRYGVILNTSDCKDTE